MMKIERSLYIPLQMTVGFQLEVLWKVIINIVKEMEYRQYMSQLNIHIMDHHIVTTRI